ncbi:MAG TPA: SEC-C metal-binding domain-containing protein [Steroidobacteraceae bacterium]|nr:SEC-C metal-binding domain-containing protein [Steroidobacteraceae bacterium]
MLVAQIHDMEEQHEDNLQEWLAGYWPALFANKPFSLAHELRQFCDDRKVSWFMRSNVIDAVVAMHAAQNEAALSEALAWVASIAQADDEDFDTRCHAGCFLLDFPRAEYRSILDELAELQGSGLGRVFDKKDVDAAFRQNADSPPWDRFKNPWDFYSPEAIQARQARWAEEDARWKQRELEALDDELFDDDYGFVEPYVREAPKIGRNEPCPCGSGKKYKKCCMLNGEANIH